MFLQIIARVLPEPVLFSQVSRFCFLCVVSVSPCLCGIFLIRRGETTEAQKHRDNTEKKLKNWGLE